MEIKVSFDKFNKMFSSIKKPTKQFDPFENLGCFIGEKDELRFWLKKKRLIPSNIPQRGFYGQMLVNENKTMTIQGEFRFSLKTKIWFFAIAIFFFIIGTGYFPIDFFGILKNIICSFIFLSFLLGFSLLTSIKEERDTIKLLKSMESEEIPHPAPEAVEKQQ